MSSNILQTKKKLSLYFAVIVFIIISLLGVLFFSAKYIESSQRETRGFQQILNNIADKKLSLEDIWDRQTRAEKFYEGGRERSRNAPSPKLGQNGFLNILVISQSGSILQSQLKDDIEIASIEKLLETDFYGKLVKEDGFLLGKLIGIKNSTIVIFKQLSYKQDSYLSEMLSFLLLSIIFSGLIYFVGRKFVNKTFVPIEENISDMKNFIHNAGHELKTPLAVIDSNLQLITELKSYDPSLNTEMKSEVLKLNSLIESLINLSDIDAFKGSQENNLYELVEEICREYSNKLEEKTIRIMNLLGEKTIIEANRDYLYMLLSNIIGNAIKYNKQYGEICIDYSKKTLSIRDTGIGIPEKNQSKIFNRFYQADNSRGVEGFGIGLSLVKKIADIYKWRISLESEVGKGTTIRVKFG